MTRQSLIFITLLLINMVSVPSVYAQTKPASADQINQTKNDVAAKEKEIADLDQKIKELRGQRQETAAEAEIIEAQVKQLDQQLSKAQLELKATQQTISKVQSEQVNNSSTIKDLEGEMQEKRQNLQALLRALYHREQDSIIRVFFSTWSFSEVLTEQAAYKQLQEQTVQLVQEMRQKQEDLTKRQQELDEQEQDLGQLEDLLANQKQDINSRQQERSKFLQAKKEEQAGYEELIKEAQTARTEISQSIFKLQSAEVEVSLDSAVDMAKYASTLTGVRSPLLMAVLKVESDVGNNIGSGKFPDDMQPASREPFLRITKKLGLDPLTAKISRRPASGNGWGGAVGPAQIMPQTWEGMEPRLTQLTKKTTVNPYNLADAFVATAIFLADRGAANPASEREAVGRYIAGPNWEYYSWYIDKVMAVAKEYEKAS